MKLEDFFKDHPKAAVAFSGGVDSSYLLYAAAKYGAEAKGYYVKSEFQPRFELEDALRLAAEINVSVEVIPVSVLSCPDVAANGPDRCYHCKKMIFQAIAEAARKDGFDVLLDGTNASDEEGDRPGMRALAELKVLSPLRLCGITKAEVRALSKEAGLFTHDKPAYACLATRTPTGTPITCADLERTEKAEDYLFSLGFSDFRVRTMCGCAKIQMPCDQIARLIEMRGEILNELKKYYPSVLLDLEVRK